MSKRKNKIDSRQMNLFDVLKRIQEEKVEELAVDVGTLNIAEKLRSALSKAIKNCRLSRHQIAGEMSHLLGYEVSKTTIDTWTAESKDQHRIPAEYLPAFCKATGDLDPIRILAECGGMFAMPGPEALRAEIQKYDEQERKARAEKRKRLKYLEDMEVAR
jgi:hypothetical protein